MIFLVITSSYSIALSEFQAKIKDIDKLNFGQYLKKKYYEVFAWGDFY